jgi:hypothetical protein
MVPRGSVAGVGLVGGVGSAGSASTRRLPRSAHRSITELEADVGPRLNQRMKRRSQTLVWTKTADQTLDTLAAYCTRINDSQH